MKWLCSFIIISFICSRILGQELNEPLLLGSLDFAEAPGEFLLHDVMERSEGLLKDNPNGKIVVRICSSENFSTAFIKASVNPLAASSYNDFTKRIIVPDEKIFVANSSKCSEKQKFVFNEYWFVPNNLTIDFDEIYNVKNISFQSWWINEYNSEKNKRKSFAELSKEFNENLNEFVEKLKSDSNVEGFIVFSSKNTQIKRNIQRVYDILKKEKVNSLRIKILKDVRWHPDKNGKMKPQKVDNSNFPTLKILTIKK